MPNNQSRQIVGVICDTYGNDLSSLETVLYLPLPGQMGTPSIIVRDRGATTLDRIAS